MAIGSHGTGNSGTRLIRAIISNGLVSALHYKRAGTPITRRLNEDLANN